MEAQGFSYEFFKIFKNTRFAEHLGMAASGINATWPLHFMELY